MSEMVVSSTRDSLTLIPPFPALILSGKVGGRSIWRGMQVFLLVLGVSFCAEELALVLVVSGGEATEMECSMRATACAQISPVRRHCILGQTVSMSVSEWILTVTRVGLGLAPARNVPVMTLPLVVESSTEPCLNRSLPALFAFQPAAFAIHFSVISMCSVSPCMGFLQS